MKFGLLVTLFLIQLFSLKAAEPFREIPPSMQSSVSSLYKFSETRTFLSSFEERVTLKWSPMGKDYANALWEGGSRTIFLNSSKEWTQGKMTCSILLELHNAFLTEKLVYFDDLAKNKQLSKHEYIMAVEKFEHENALKTSTLLERGIRLGFFPRDASYPIYKDFASHIDLQMRMGHSAIIGAHFDAITT